MFRHIGVLQWPVLAYALHSDHFPNRKNEISVAAMLKLKRATNTQMVFVKQQREIVFASLRKTSRWMISTKLSKKMSLARTTTSSQFWGRPSACGFSGTIVLDVVELVGLEELQDRPLDQLLV